MIGASCIGVSTLGRSAASLLRVPRCWLDPHGGAGRRQFGGHAQRSIRATIHLVRTGLPRRRPALRLGTWGDVDAIDLAGLRDEAQAHGAIESRLGLDHVCVDDMRAGQHLNMQAVAPFEIDTQVVAVDGDKRRRTGNAVLAEHRHPLPRKRRAIVLLNDERHAAAARGKQHRARERESPQNPSTRRRHDVAMVRRLEVPTQAIQIERGRQAAKTPSLFSWRLGVLAALLSFRVPRARRRTS